MHCFCSHCVWLLRFEHEKLTWLRSLYSTMIFLRMQPRSQGIFFSALTGDTTCYDMLKSLNLQKLNKEYNPICRLPNISLITFSLVSNFNFAFQIAINFCGNLSGFLKPNVLPLLEISTCKWKETNYFVQSNWVNQYLTFSWKKKKKKTYWTDQNRPGNDQKRPGTEEPTRNRPETTRNRAKNYLAIDCHGFPMFTLFCTMPSCEHD